MATEKEQYTHKRCIICSTEETSKNICKDKESYDKLMKFFWEGLSVDMKPMEYKNHEFCHECCSKIVEFYDTNEVLIKLEKHMRTLQKTLIRSSVQSVQKLKRDGHPLLRVHKSLFEKWGSGFKSEDEADDKSNEQEVTSYLEADGKAEADKTKATPAAKNSRPPRPRRAAAAAAATKSRKKQGGDEETSDSTSENGSSSDD